MRTATQHELSSAISGEVLEYYEYLTTRVHALAQSAEVVGVLMEVNERRERNKPP